MGNKKPKRPKRDTKRHPQGSASPAVTPVVIQAAPNQNAVVAKCANQENAGHKMDKLKWTDLVMAAATVGILIAGILQWCAMSGQLKEMQSGSADTRKLADSTLAASRAWVVVQGTGFGFTKDKNFPTGRVVLADSGNSPAFGVEGWRCVEVREDDPPMQDGRLQKSPTAICSSVAGGTIGEGVPIEMDAFIPAQVPADFSRDTEGTGSHFYYWGTITYDIYPSDGKRHSTSFCLKNGQNQMGACREGGYQTD